MNDHEMGIKPIGGWWFQSSSMWFTFLIVSWDECSDSVALQVILILLLNPYVAHATRILPPPPPPHHHHHHQSDAPVDFVHLVVFISKSSDFCKSFKP